VFYGSKFPLIEPEHPTETLPESFSNLFFKREREREREKRESKTIHRKERKQRENYTHG